jgi:dGTP triphosphohydrolase
VTAALIIYTLQAPHINEARDAKMDEIESVMNTREKAVRSALADLSQLVDGRGRTFLDTASSAFEEFMKVNAEVVRLSRINSNIKSLELSLGRKRNVATQCEETLNAIQNVIRDRTFKATK